MRTKNPILKGESKFQAACCQILDLTKLLYFAIPNGSNKQSWQSQWLFKVTGLKSGVPDLFIAEPFQKNDVKSRTLYNIQYHGMFIECKFGDNDITDNQTEWINKLRGRGYFCAVIKTTDELIDLLKLYYPDYIKHIKF